MRIAIWCDTCQKVLDEGEVKKDSSLILFNDFTDLKRKHIPHKILIRLASNCKQKTAQGKCL